MTRPHSFKSDPSGAAGDLAGGSVGAAAPAPLQDLLMRAVNLHQGGQVAAALEGYRTILKSDPRQPQALFFAGTASLQLGELKKSVKYLKSSLAQEPHNAAAQCNLGNAFRLMGKLKPAEAACRRALGLDAGFVDAQATLALVLQDQGKMEDAAKSYEAALALAPDSPELLSNLGGVYRQMKKLPEAVECFQKALNIRPDYANAHNNLGNVLMGQENYEAAIEHFEKAMALDPEAAYAGYVNIGNALRQSKKYKEAIESYRQALAILPQSVDVLNNMGMCLSLDGLRDDAIECYLQAISLEPDYAWAHHNLAGCYMVKGAMEAARKAFEHAISLDPSCDVFHTSLAAHLLSQGDYHGSIRSCDACFKADPGNSYALAIKSIALDELGERDQVRKLVDFDRFIRAKKFTAPDGYESMEAFNQALSKHVHEHPSLVHEPLHKTTRKGMQTGELLVEPKGPIAQLEEMIHEAVREYKEALPLDPDHPFLARQPEKYHLTAWSVILESQGHQLPHNHPDGWLSGCYYVRLPDVMHGAQGGNEEGWIEFGEPEPSYNTSVEPEVRACQPEEGTMFLFPSHMWHRTIPFDSKQERICIAFDVLPDKD